MGGGVVRRLTTKRFNNVPASVRRNWGEKEKTPGRNVPLVRSWETDPMTNSARDSAVRALPPVASRLTAVGGERTGFIRHRRSHAHARRPGQWARCAPCGPRPPRAVLAALFCTCFCLFFFFQEHKETFRCDARPGHMVARCPDEEVNGLEFWPGPRPLMFVKKQKKQNIKKKTILRHERKKGGTQTSFLYENEQFCNSTVTLRCFCQLLPFTSHRFQCYYLIL